jgi:transcription termination factor 2
VLKRIFGPKREEDGSWGKLHNDELQSLYSSRNIVMVIKSRRIRWAGHVARMEEGRGIYSVLVGRPEFKRPLGRPSHKWDDNIKVDLRQTEIEGAKWIQLPQDRVQWRAFVNTVMNLRVP